MVEDSVVFLAVAERGYPRKLVFSYLAEVHRAFAEQLQAEFGATWRQQVGTIDKPYAFLKFGAEVPLPRLAGGAQTPLTRAPRRAR